MIQVSTHGVELWADDLYSYVQCKAPPVDLYAMARYRRVKRVGQRLMVRLGALIPVEQGYEILLQGLETVDFDISAPEPPDALTARQRFSLAHEIAHTFFYKFTEHVPVRTISVKKYQDYKDLENICDRAAKRILVPMQLLRTEVQRILGDRRQIDAAFVRQMVSIFRVSYEVMLERLRTMEPENEFARCILLVRENEDEAQVKTWYMGMGLLSAFPPLEKYRPVADWFPEFPRELVAANGSRECKLTRKGRELLFRKVPLGRAGDFLLQVDDLGHGSPSPN